jgi:AcrR family transcriptional regulator
VGGSDPKALEELRGRSRKKAEQILGGARAAFLELGYGSASVDVISKRAGVSKATLYAYFKDKEALFSAVVGLEIRTQSERLTEVVASGEDPEMDLFRLVRRFLEYLVSPVPRELFRIVIAESARFPELGRAFYASGPQIGVDLLIDTLSRSSLSAGRDIDDPARAARVLVDLCKGDFFQRVLLHVEPEPSSEALDAAAREVCEVFSTMYPPSKEKPARQAAPADGDA